MKTRTKAVLLVLCAMVLVFASVLGTMAYLTSTDKVTNTFTVGDVEIELDEAKVDEYGKAIEGAERVKANEYKLLPGHTYVKDPTVRVTGGSEVAYIRMLVKVADYAQLTEAIPAPAEGESSDYYGADGVFNIGALVNGHDSTAWVYEGFDSATSTYEFRYYVPVDARETEEGSYLTITPLFKEIKVPGFIENDALKELEGVKFEITAEAIQADGFADADAAWTAFGTQTSQN